MGTTPARLVSPTVGLIPTTELELEGHKMDPDVSVPSVTAAIFAATDVAEPVLEPHGSADLRYGFYIESDPQYGIISVPEILIDLEMLHRKSTFCFLSYKLLKK